MNECHVIDATAQMRHEIAHPFAGLTILFPIPGAFHAWPRVALKEFDLASRIKLLTMAFDQLRFVIKRVALAGRAGHEELNDPLRFRAVVNSAVQVGARRGRERLRQKAMLSEQVREGNSAESSAETPKKLAAVQEPRVLSAELNRRLLR